VSLIAAGIIGLVFLLHLSGILLPIEDGVRGLFLPLQRGGVFRQLVGRSTCKCRMCLP
jgi:hypothetical protein